MTIRTLRPGDDSWPNGLNELGGFSAPERLYVQGRPLAAIDRCVSIVGTRRPTAAGLEITRTMSQALVEAGFCVVSGLAIGIDAAAHAAALETGGHTVGVLGCGLDVAYPERNLKLKRLMIESGTLVSEYPPGTLPFKAHFPERNRIIAGLSCGVIVVEGGPRSGALITARRALDAGRNVWAVPGSVRNPMSRGPNELIRTGQAALVTGIEQIFEELAPGLVWKTASAAAPPALEEDDSAVLAALDDVATGVDRISMSCGLTGGRLALALARLEIRNLARRQAGGYVITEGGARARATSVQLSLSQEDA